MEKITSFDECFEKQENDATKLQKSVANDKTNSYEVNKDSVSAGSSVLCDDLVFHLKNGKAVKLTARGQELVHNQVDSLLEARYMVDMPASGQCLHCGKKFKSGDFAVIEKVDSQNRICLSCATGSVEIREGGNETLVRFVGEL